MAVRPTTVGNDTLGFCSPASYEAPRAGNEVSRKKRSTRKQTKERAAPAMATDNKTRRFGLPASSKPVSAGGEMRCSLEKDIGEEMKLRRKSHWKVEEI